MSNFASFNFAASSTECVTLNFVVAMRLKAYYCGCLIATITSSNSHESLDVPEFVACYVVGVCLTRRIFVWRSPTGRVCLISFDVISLKRRWGWAQTGL